MAFNPNRKHQLITSIDGGSWFLQDGKKYSRSGREIPDPQKKQVEVADDPPVKEPLPQFSAQPIEQNRPLEDLHWTQVKVLVEKADGKWTNREQGVEFLKSLREG